MCRDQSSLASPFFVYIAAFGILYLAFGAFEAPEPFGEVSGEGTLSGVAPAIARADYNSAFATIAAFIAAGDCYQVNLTFPMRARL